MRKNARAFLQNYTKDNLGSLSALSGGSNPVSSSLNNRGLHRLIGVADPEESDN
jgi:hypothetical protein